MENRKHNFMPINWQRALIAYGLALGVSLFSNSVMWGHIDSLNHPYSFYLKVGLIGIIDFANFWMATWVVFGRSARLRAYGFWWGLVLMIVMLIHTGALMKLEGSKTENLTMIKAVGDESAKIVEAGTRGAMTGAAEGAIKANDEEQYRTSRALRAEGQKTSVNIVNEAQKNLTDKASELKPRTFLPQAYLDGGMYWALMVLAGVLLAFGVKVSEEEGEGLIPDNLERLVTGRTTTQPVRLYEYGQDGRLVNVKYPPFSTKPTVKWRGMNRVDDDKKGNGLDGGSSSSH
jgi:hypothetical protein